ncbi:MAG: hypothetical protein AVDCRST_MAG90-201 [uncultured Microvirga sp.]|uniref:DUF3035 domain-containing protein n=1 Tax=uncultured Microvirga sp. TaxID=412392 RepID=A0A6J4KK13_9HYPH|nr:MAG: hypothetical protein AVDCRST_MAG90-201 [uncultured Microvirga sp.]
MNGFGIACWAVLVAFGVGATANGAAAQEGAFMKDILGTIGILPKDRDPIDYRERAPLVVPPKLELRPPAGAGSAEARNPQWPRDPDVAAARRREAEARVPTTETERRRFNNDSGGRLSVEEIRAGRRAGAGVPTDPVYRHGDGGRGDSWVDPKTLRAKSKDAAVVADAEPDRQLLTEPPTGYRKPAAGSRVRADSEPVTREDEADPKAYLVQDRKRRE